MDAPYYNGDDDRDSLTQPAPALVHHPDPDGECECHCDRCGVALSLDPVYGKWYARCGDCWGGGEPDYDGAAEMHARRTDPTHPANVEMMRLKR